MLVWLLLVVLGCVKGRGVVCAGQVSG